MMARRLFLLVYLCLCSGLLADSLSIPFSFESSQLVIGTEENYDTIRWADGTPSEWLPGQPWLPTHNANILIPAGAEITKVSLLGDESLIGSASRVLPFQPPTPLSQLKPQTFVEPLSDVYDGTRLFPADRLEQGTLHRMRAYRFLSVRLHPVRWNPASGQLLFSSNMTVHVEYTLTNSPVMQADSPVAQGIFRDTVAGLVVNPQDLNTQPSPTFLLYSDGSPATVDYLIITDVARSNAFQQLADYRSSFNGWNTRVLTTESISTNYTGVDTQEKIHNCIKEYVDNYGLTYVVLGGDNTIVPDRDCYVSVGSYTESNMPTDLYYSGLDSTWDEDGDGTYGEADYSGTKDEGDLAYDVIVGRIPIRTATQATDYINKMIGYESTNRPSSDFNKKLMVMGETLWTSYTGSSIPSDICADGHLEFQSHSPVSDCEIWVRRMYRDNIRPYWEATTQFSVMTDTLTSWDGSTAGDYALDLTHATARFNEGWNLINMYTHGNWNIWALESGYFQSAHAAALTNLTAIVYTEACITAQFDTTSDPCLSEAFLRNPNGGAVIYIGSSRYGWGSPGSYSGGTSAEYAIDYYDQLFNQGIANAGLAFAQHKAANIANCGNNGSYRWCQFSLNLQGDPGLTLAVTPPRIFLTSPLDGASIKKEATTTLETYIVDGYTTITSVAFYADGQLVATDSTRPFSASWSPTNTGEIALHILGYDLEGNAYTSGVSTVESVLNLLPSISVTNPIAEAVYAEGETVTLGADAYDADGTVTQVRFQVDGTTLDSLTSSPWTSSWTMAGSGAHAVTAMAWDDNGGTVTSAAITIYQPSDHFTELFDDTAFDLAGYSLTFTPTADTNYTACLTAISELPHDINDGDDLGLQDGETSTIMLFGSSFPFYGTSHSIYYVNDNGNISLDNEDPTAEESLAAHFAQARISLFFDDLDPGSGGAVRHLSNTEKIVVTYDSVPELGTSNVNTGQIEIFFDGTIRLSWLNVDLTNSLVGLSAGGGIPAGYADSDLSAYESCFASAIETTTNAMLIAEGTQQQFGMRLTEDPGSLVEVTVACTNGDADISCTCASAYQYDPSSWSQWQWVTLTAAEDVDTLSGSNTVACTGEGLTSAFVSVLEVDNDNDVPDTDSDSLPDWWELQHFDGLTNAVPELDADEDGLSNMDEWISGADPTNSQSVFNATPQFTNAQNAAVLSWPSLDGRRYEVFCCSNLNSAFHLLATNILPTPPLNVFTDTVNSVETQGQFYRIRVRMAP